MHEKKRNHRNTAQRMCERKYDKHPKQLVPENYNPWAPQGTSSISVDFFRLTQKLVIY